MSFFEKRQKISPEKTEAYFDYKKQAKKGDVTAQFYLGECYYNGTGVEQNREKALKWYSKANATISFYFNKALPFAYPA